MIEVAGEDAFEGLPGATLGGGREIGEVRQFGPDEHAEAIGDLVIARIRHLDVDAKAVESEPLCLQQLILEKFQRRRRADAVGVIILIQGAAKIERLAVEQQAAVPRLDGAEAERVAPTIDRDAVAHEAQSQPVEMGLIG